MRITAQEEYGLRCILLLARAEEGDALTIPEISRREGISIPYVGKLMMRLKQAGLVQAVRGRNGGYRLASRPETLPLSAIFDVLGDPIYSLEHCRRRAREKGECVHDEDCTVRSMWKSFDGFISGVLHRVTLADLAGGNFTELDYFRAGAVSEATLDGGQS